MIRIIIGTRAQVIKTAPIMRELEARHVPFELYLTGQHRATIFELLKEFDVASAPVELYGGPEVKSLGRVIPWAFSVLKSARRVIPSTPPGAGHRHVYVVHGDTFSTLLGIHLGRRHRGIVAHVESGLRSHNLLNPFPEEIVRLYAMRTSSIAFAPGEWAAANLHGFSVRVIDTGENTLLDSLRYALSSTQSGSLDEDRPYVLFSIHRFETLYSSRRIRLVLRFAQELSQQCKVIFVLHPSTEQRFRDLGCLDDLRATANVVLLPRMTYLPFIRLAAHARLVVTDGGSNQEELSYLGIPTILMREATERREGLGANVLLGKFDFNSMWPFAADAIRGDHGARKALADVYPSAQVADCLVAAAEGRES